MQEWMTYSTGGFPLGIDWSKPGENISNQACVQAMNCEYSPVDGALQTVPGIRTVYTADNEIEAIYKDAYRNRYYLVIGKKLYASVDLQSITLLGTLAGNHKPQFCTFGGDILIASGGQLQYLTGTGEILETVEGSPRCELVSSHSGSVMISSIYSHRIYWSAIGDYKSWKHDNYDASSAQYVDVGYKDQGSIISVSFLSKSIIVYKQYGKAYQVIGNPHDGSLTVYPLSETAYCCGESVSVDDRSYYLGDSGFMSLTPTDTYADIQPFETGLNINTMLIQQIGSGARLFHVVSRKQIWIIPRESLDHIYIYNYLPRYSDGRGAFTMRKTSHAIKDVLVNGTTVYIAYGSKIGVLDESIDTDDGQQIQTSIVSGNRLASRLFLILMNYVFVSSNRIAGKGSITISNKKTKVVDFKAGINKLVDAINDVISADESISGDEYTKILKIGGGPNRNLQIKIFLSKGAIAVHQFDYQYAEV